MNRFIRARGFRVKDRTAGNVSFSTATYADVDTATDITLRAKTGDIIEVSLSAYWTNAGNARGLLTVCSVVGGSPQNYIFGSSTDEGVQGWQGYNSVETNCLGSSLFTVQAGDIVNGTVTLRLRGRSENTTTKTLVADTTSRLRFWAKNLGPLDPN